MLFRSLITALYSNVLFRNLILSLLSEMAARVKSESAENHEIRFDEGSLDDLVALISVLLKVERQCGHMSVQAVISGILAACREEFIVRTEPVNVAPTLKT